MKDKITWTVEFEKYKGGLKQPPVILIFQAKNIKDLFNAIRKAMFNHNLSRIMSIDTNERRLFDD